jgi:hypothetical protein
MLNRQRNRHPSPALVVAFIALAVALGGTSYAVVALPKNSVGTAQLKKQAVTAQKIRANSISSGKVKDRSLLEKDFKAGQLPAGPPGQPGPSSAYFARQTGVATVASGGARATLAVLSLPAGSYTFAAQAFAFRQTSAGDPDQLICTVVSGPTVLGSLPSQITIDPTADLVLITAATLAAPATVELACSQITQSPDPADTLAIIGGRVLATRVGELTGP